MVAGNYQLTDLRGICIMALGGYRGRQKAPPCSLAARAKWIEQSSSRNTKFLEVIGEMVEHHGEQSTRNMAALLNGAGYTTARGNQFTSGQVSRIRRVAV